MINIDHPVEIPNLIRECFTKTVLSGVPFTRSYPDVEIKGPVIVWRMVRRWPGKDKKETKRGRIRGTDESDPDQVVVYFGQWQSAMFQFDLLHVNELEVEKLLLDFEMSIKEARPALCSNGVDTFFFEEQLEDTTLPISKSICTRSLRYLATMTVYTPVNIARMKEIVINVSTPVNIDTLGVTRSAINYDIVNLDMVDISIVRKDFDNNNLVYLGSGIDYYLEDLNDGTTKIIWTTYGIQPQPGDTYYITHFAMSDLVTRTVT